VHMSSTSEGSGIDSYPWPSLLTTPVISPASRWLNLRLYMVGDIVRPSDDLSPVRLSYMVLIW